MKYRAMVYATLSSAVAMIPLPDARSISLDMDPVRGVPPV